VRGFDGLLTWGEAGTPRDVAFKIVNDVHPSTVVGMQGVLR
jgi:hypothetical protein